MKNLMPGIKRFVDDEEGVAMVEYGLIGALIAVVCVATLKTIGTDVNTVFTKISNCLKNGTC